MHFDYSQCKQKGFTAKQEAGFIPILIVILIAAAVGGYFVYKNYQTKTPAPTAPPTTSSTPQPSPSPINETANWKTYTGNRYSFSYPNGWLVSKSDYLNSVQINNPNENVRIIISDSQYPFGIENPDTKMDENDLKVNIAGKDYTVKETTVSTLSTGIPRLVFINFKTDPPNIVYILISSNSPSDYQNLKSNILKILSTFRFD